MENITITADFIFEKFGKDFALGPSSLELLAYGGLRPFPRQRIAVPDNLMQLLNLISEGSSEHRLFLIRLIRYFHRHPRKSEHQDFQEDKIVDRIIDVIHEFNRHERLIVITDEEVDSDIQEALIKLYPGPAFEISLSPKRNFLRDYLVRIYSWSKHTGGVILEHGRRIFSDIGHHISTLQLPDKLDEYKEIKEHYFGAHVFGFRGGKAAKFFIGIAITSAGFAISSPIVTVPGLLIAFTDP